MKKYVLLFNLILFSFSALSQPNHNTLWAAFDGSGNFFAYYYFHYDTMSSSPDNITYTPESYYTYDGFMVRLADLTGLHCPTTDTGNYSVWLSADTMIFAYNGDPCFMRQIFYSTYFFVRTQGTLSKGELTINPSVIYDASASSLKIGRLPGKSTLRVSDEAGRLIKTAEVDGSSTVSIPEPGSGLYFYELYSGDKKFSGRFLKE